MMANSGSLAFRGIDPAELMERNERQRQRRRAAQIAKLPEHLWPRTVQAEAKDNQEGIWFYLNAIRTARSLCRT